MTELAITVYGVPGPQGSKRHVGNGVMVESSKKVKPWREDVRAAAIDAMALFTEPFNDDQIRAAFDRLDKQPLTVRIIFTLPRPKGHYGTGRNTHHVKDSAPCYPAVKPDLDKLIRSTLDALGSAGVYGDDSQIVRVVAEKVYAGEDGALDRPGAHIRIGGAA